MGFQITRPYKNVCGMDLSLVHVFGLIKNLQAYLFYFPDISTLMDVIVVDLTPVYRIILSQGWSIVLDGKLHMDLSYAIIPNSDGDMVRIHCDPFYDGHLEWYEDRVKNSCVHGELFLDGMFMVMEGDNNSPRSQDDTTSIWR